MENVEGNRFLGITYGWARVWVGIRVADKAIKSMVDWYCYFFYRVYGYFGVYAWGEATSCDGMAQTEAIRFAWFHAYNLNILFGVLHLHLLYFSRFSSYSCLQHGNRNEMLGGAENITGFSVFPSHVPLQGARNWSRV